MHALSCGRSISCRGGNVSEAGGSHVDHGDEGKVARAAGSAADLADAAGSATIIVASDTGIAAEAAAIAGGSSAPATAACAGGDAKLLPTETSATAAIAGYTDEAAACRGSVAAAVGIGAPAKALRLSQGYMHPVTVLTTMLRCVE